MTGRPLLELALLSSRAAILAYHHLYFLFFFVSFFHSPFRFLTRFLSSYIVPKIMARMCQCRGVFISLHLAWEIFLFHFTRYHISLFLSLLFSTFFIGSFSVIQSLTYVLRSVITSLLLVFFVFFLLIYYLFIWQSIVFMYEHVFRSVFFVSFISFIHSTFNLFWFFTNKILRL